MCMVCSCYVLCSRLGLGLVHLCTWYVLGVIDRGHHGPQKEYRSRPKPPPGSPYAPGLGSYVINILTSSLLTPHVINGGRSPYGPIGPRQGHRPAQTGAAQQ